MTKRSELIEFITDLSDRRLYEMGAILHVAFEEYYGGMNSGIGDDPDISNADEFLSLCWAVSTRDGKNEPPE